MFHSQRTAAMDALGNLAGTPEGVKQLSGLGVVETAINVMCKHPEMLQRLLNAGLLQSIQQGLLNKYEDPNCVCSIMGADPKLAQGLAEDNARGFIQAIRAHQDNPAVPATGGADLVV